MLASFFLALVASVLVTQVAVFSTTIYLHRTATHKALVLHPCVEWVFRFALWLTTGQLTKEWVAVHRKHHAFTDEEGDPHSPALLGFWRVQLGNVFYYIREVEEHRRRRNATRATSKTAGGTARVQSRHRRPAARHALPFARCLASAGACSRPAFTPIMYVFVLSSSINGLCHHVGYKNFENTATNIRVLALITGGEGLHNNHHGYPRSPKFSFRPSEFDPAWPIIRLLIALKLAKPYKTIHEVAA